MPDAGEVAPDLVEPPRALQPARHQRRRAIVITGARRDRVDERDGWFGV
jgi:hypothetical protein